MTPVGRLLDRLQRTRKAGDGRWMCRCPAHEDRSASLSIRELEDRRVLIHCFAGCETGAILGALGLQLTDLFPEPIGAAVAPARDRSHWHGQRAAIQAVRDDLTFIEVVVASLSAGAPKLSPVDVERLSAVADRVRQACEALYGRR